MIRYLRFFFILSLFLSSTQLSYSQIVPPYVQNFDLNATGWTHYATIGTDDWELGTPTYLFVNQTAFTSPNAWATDLDTNAATNSGRFLESPAFDFSGITAPHYLEFYHLLNTDGQNNGYASVNYSIDSGSTWNQLNSSNNQEKFSWYNSTNGWTGLHAPMRRSAHTMAALLGQSDVRFRFGLSTQSTTSHGWVIDNFRIEEITYNITGLVGDTLFDVSKNSLDKDVNVSYIVHNPLGENFLTTADYYVSADTVIDPSDTLYHSTTMGIANSHPGLIVNIPMLQGLQPGLQYILVQLDAQDTVGETNELDNVVIIPMVVEATIDSIYIEDFENVAFPFDILRGTAAGPDQWELGSGWSPHLERAHSGNNAYHTSMVDTLGIWQYTSWLRTPYIDMTAIPANYILSFWYKNHSGTEFVRFTEHNSWHSNFISLPQTDSDDWEFTNHPILNVKNAVTSDARFVFEKHGDGSSWNGDEGWSIDDLYLGPPKPDLTIERHKVRNTNSLFAQETLAFELFNSGPVAVDTLKTDFWWSTDTQLDAGDQFVGTHEIINLPGEIDTLMHFSFQKPTTTPGTYYLIYRIDSAQVVDEMREYNNSGYFTYLQQDIQTLPYFNDFETSVEGWWHESSLQADPWVWATPNGNVLDAAFSGTKAWVTNDTGTIAPMTRAHLYTPSFNLTNVTQPVLEFKKRDDSRDVPQGPSFGYGETNVHYSIDNGRTWHVLDTVNTLNFSQWSPVMGYGDYAGQDLIIGWFDTKHMMERRERTLRATKQYQGRHTDNHYTFSVDISFLKGNDNVQFRFNYFSADNDREGVLIDDFKIREGFTDLTIAPADIKSLGLDSNANGFTFNVDIQNAGNIFSTSSNASFYLSVDDSVDAGDLFVSNVNLLTGIRPFYKEPIRVNSNLLGNPQNYNYLVYEIDVQNTVNESDETNNTGAFPLGIHTPETAPYFNDFEDYSIDGWVWYHNNSGTLRDYQFRHREIVEDGAAFDATGGYWFTDRMGFNQLANIPIQYLESPSFDFTTDTALQLEFDFICIGSPNQDGANVQYSTDGGNTWQVLHAGANNPTPPGWYAWNTSLAQLNNEPGWDHETYDVWTHTQIDISSVAGQGDVKFRFQYKSDESGIWGIHGFRLDNFEINSNLLGLNLVNQPATCAGAQDGSIQTTVGGGTGPYTFNWSNGANSGDLQNLSAGWYFVTVTDSTGTVLTDSIEIVEPGINPVSVSLISQIDTIQCFGSTEGTITTAGSGGVHPLTYTWAHCASGPIATGLSAGTYTVTVSDGCSSATVSTTIVGPASPIQVNMLSMQSLTCNGINDAAVAVQALGGYGGFSYQWSNGSTNSSITGLSLGTYTVTMTDISGCSETRSYFFPEENPLLLDASVGLETCDGDSNGIAVVTPLNGTPPYSYNWSGGAQGQDTAFNLTSGFYAVTVIDSLGCFSNAGLIVDYLYDIPPVYLGTDVEICEGETATLEPIQPGFIFYDWSTGQTSSSIDVTNEGNYTVTVTDGNGCTNLDEIFVAVDSCDTTSGGTSVQAWMLQTGQVKLYPNPSDGQINVMLTDLTSETVRIEVFDPLGKLVLHASGSGVQSERITFDLSPYRQGVYHFRITSGDRVIHQKVLIL